MTSYNGVLSVYEKAILGNKAPELKISSRKDTKAVPVNFDFTNRKSGKTLLVFYQSGCSHCDAVMNTLSSRQNDLLNNDVNLIAVSADVDEKIFKEASEKLHWKGILSCDLKGMNGGNFLNYGVQATPTLFVIDQQGNIITRESTVEPVLKALADPSAELWKTHKTPRPVIPPTMKQNTF